MLIILVNMDLNKLSKVDFQTTNVRGYSNLRGHGVLNVSKVRDNGVSTTKNNYNLLQPLTKPYGNHLPPTTNKELDDRNSQTTLAWDNPQ